MPLLSVGDLAHTYQLRRLSTALKTDLGRLGAELSSGRKADIGALASGDFGPVAAIERSLAALAAYRTANAEAATFLDAAQLMLGDVQEMGRDLSPALLAAGTAHDPAMLNATAEDARQKFQAAVARLNARVADRTVLAGMATDGPALATGGAILAELVTATAGSVTADDVVVAVDAWFDTPGGGFETMAYLGAVSDLAPLGVADGERIPFNLRADSPTLRETMKGLALGALVAEGVLDGDTDQKAALMTTAAERLLTSDGALTGERASLGAAQKRVEDARARNAAEDAAYQLALNDLVVADPYETATRLEEVLSQIQTLYTVTARISGLRLTDYMR
jgi:flagellar hook-associated protein 3 FlgL